MKMPKTTRKAQKPNDRILCNDNDIKHALHQADLAEALEARGISPYTLFNELNTMAKNIAKSGAESMAARKKEAGKRK